MRQLVVIAILFIKLTFVYASQTEIIEKGDFEKAQIKAKEEGKLLFLDFYARWCTPCKWMSETTLQDPEVQSKLKKDFIAVKVNIDDFEGFELKSRFDIRYLPTILIFNSDGIMIERVEQTVGTSKMIELLHETAGRYPSNRIHEVNSSPSEIFHNNLVTTSHEENSSRTSSAEVKIFQLQMGVFSSLQNASNLSNDLKSKFTRPVTILEQNNDGQVVYKVFMGQFDNEQSANDYKEFLMRDFQLDSKVL